MAENFNPLVSIVIPVYNGSNYMREAIDSALAQIYKNIEVLVINDGSNDNGATREIALSYGNKIRYFEKLNGGVATALNLGIRKMKGEYFSWLSHDDVYYPDKIEKQINYLKTQIDKNIGLYGDFVFIDSYSSVVRFEKIRHKKKNSLYSVLNGLIHGCTLLIPKIFFNEFGLFDSSLATTQDYALWFNFFKKYKIHHISHYFVKSRVHSQQGSNTISSFCEERENLYSNFLNNISEAEIHYLEKNAAKFYIKMSLFLISAGLKKSATVSYQKYLLANKKSIYYELFYKLYTYDKINIRKYIYLLKNPKIAFLRMAEKISGEIQLNKPGK
jgi:glycosyltransferase involved in cell wall biosynthesis